MKYLKKYNESLEPTSDEINDIFNIEFEAYDFSVSYESYTPFESYEYPDKIMFNIYLCLDFQDNQEMVDLYNACRHTNNKKPEIDMITSHITNMINPIQSRIASKYDYTILDIKINPLTISDDDDGSDNIRTKNIEKCDLTFDILIN